MERPYVLVCKVAQRILNAVGNWMLSLPVSNPTPLGIVAGLFNQEAADRKSRNYFGAPTQRRVSHSLSVLRPRTEPIKFPRS